MPLRIAIWTKDNKTYIGL
ncbi:hypothetical protein [Nanobdella aerobiophila]